MLSILALIYDIYNCLNLEDTCFSNSSPLYRPVNQSIKAITTNILNTFIVFSSLSNKCTNLINYLRGTTITDCYKWTNCQTIQTNSEK